MQVVGGWGVRACVRACAYLVCVSLLFFLGGWGVGGDNCTTER